MSRGIMEDPLLGPAAPELGWVPAPRYLMRRARIRRMFATMPPALLLEIGPGAGALILEAARSGFSCTALETSPEAQDLAKRIWATAGVEIPVHAEPQANWGEHFDVVCSFEVLEHIEDHQAALAQWRSWLRPGGQLLLSVPAHMSLWSAGDEWAGHYRRYERESLIELVRHHGFAIESFECYGFPLTNLSERFSAKTYARRMRERAVTGSDSKADGTARSGVDRTPHLRLFPFLASWPGRMGLRMCDLVQGAFARTDLGSGYLLRARRT